MPQDNGRILVFGGHVHPPPGAPAAPVERLSAVLELSLTDGLVTLRRVRDLPEGGTAGHFVVRDAIELRPGMGQCGA